MALAQARVLTGARAMTLARPSTSKVSNGSRWFMKRKDSYMVEVEVGEDETEDVAVRNFMKSVVQSGVIEQLRARRTKETKIMEYKRKLQARAMARRLGILEPTWEELYGNNDLGRQPQGFDDFFVHDEDGDDYDLNGGMGDLNVLYGNSGSAQMPAFDNGGTEMFDLGAYEQATGQAGGYIDAPAEGGYMDQPPAAAGSNGLQQ